MRTSTRYFALQALEVLLHQLLLACAASGTRQPIAHLGERHDAAGAAVRQLDDVEAELRLDEVADLARLERAGRGRSNGGTICPFGK